MYHLVYKDEKSNKFWQLELEGNGFTITYGKVGTKGQTQTKSFDTPEDARKEAEKLVASKRQKGYVDVESEVSAEDAADVEKRQAELTRLIEKIEEFVDDNSRETLVYYPNALASTMGDIDDEAGLYALAIQYPVLRTMVVKVFDALMTSFENRNVLWANDVTQAGQRLSEYFALENKSDIPMLTRFVNLCDIDHSSDVYEQVIRVWNKWGFCEETCYLIVSFMMRSQDGDTFPETLDEQEQGITPLMQEAKPANLLLANIRKWLDSDVPWAKNYHRSDRALKNEVTETLTPLLEGLFQIDTVEAEESAEKFVALYIAGKTPKINQIYKKPEAPLQKGNAEQLFAAIMDSMDELGQKVYEKSIKGGMELNLDTKTGLAKPEPTRMSILAIVGQKYNKIMHYVNGYVPDNWVVKKFEGMDFSEVPESFFADKLTPAFVKWVQNKVDTQAYVNLYGGQVTVSVSARDTGMGWIKETVDRREYLQDWLNRFSNALTNREFTGWTCEEFGADVNLWLVFALADQVGADLVLEFLSTVNTHLKQQHPDSKPCVQTDIKPYMEAYFEKFKKETANKEQAEIFLKILAEANTFYKLSKGKNLPFNKKAMEFAKEIIALAP